MYAGIGGVHVDRIAADDSAMPTKLVTAERLREKLRYEPETGVFNWRSSGDVAGHSGKRYWYIKVDNVKYYAHRLAWLYMTGEWPEHGIDHIDGDRYNNRFSNLRDIPQGENVRNSSLRSDNTSGLRGVCARGRRWVAAIGVNRKTVTLGSFATKEEAGAAYLAARARLFSLQPIPREFLA